MISAQMATAVSSGVRAPMSRPIGPMTRARPASSTPASRKADRPVVVGPPRTHGPQVADVGLQGRHDGRHVELRVVGEHADRVAGPEAGADLGQVLVRPGHHHLVGHREAGPGGEHRPGVADRHPVAEDLGHLGQGGGEVDGAEDDHPGRRGERLDEDRQVPAPGLAVAPVVAGPGQPGGQLALGVAADHPIQVRVAEAARAPASAGPGSEQQLAAEQLRRAPR